MINPFYNCPTLITPSPTTHSPPIPLHRVIDTPKGFILTGSRLE